MENIKAFQVRMSKDLWIFVKKTAAEREMTMTGLVEECIANYQKIREIKLALMNNSDIMIDIN